MKDLFDASEIKESAKKRTLLFISVGSLILNLLVFALAIPETRVISLVLAGAFLIYIPIGLFEKESNLVTYLTRALEITVSLSLTIAYIILFKKYFLLFLPVIEIATPILIYFLVFKRRK